MTITERKHCHQCDNAFTLFRQSVRGEEGLCEKCGWVPVEHKPKYGRRGFMAMCLGAAASALMPRVPISGEVFLLLPSGLKITRGASIWTVASSNFTPLVLQDWLIESNT